MHSTKELFTQLTEIGVAKGMNLLVHSSLKRLGPIERGADGIIDTLLAAIAPGGTLMMPTVSANVNGWSDCLSRCAHAFDRGCLD